MCSCITVRSIGLFFDSISLKVPGSASANKQMERGLWRAICTVPQNLLAENYRGNICAPAWTVQEESCGRNKLEDVFTVGDDVFVLSISVHSSLSSSLSLSLCLLFKTLSRGVVLYTVYVDTAGSVHPPTVCQRRLSVRNDQTENQTQSKSDCVAGTREANSTLIRGSKREKVERR